jgi:hypothetical protein
MMGFPTKRMNGTGYCEVYHIEPTKRANSTMKARLSHLN